MSSPKLGTSLAQEGRPGLKEAGAAGGRRGLTSQGTVLAPGTWAWTDAALLLRNLLSNMRQVQRDVPRLGAWRDAQDGYGNWRGGALHQLWGGLPGTDLPPSRKEENFAKGYIF